MPLHQLPPGKHALNRLLPRLKEVLRLVGGRPSTNPISNWRSPSVNQRRTLPISGRPSPTWPAWTLLPAKLRTSSRECAILWVCWLAPAATAPIALKQRIACRLSLRTEQAEVRVPGRSQGPNQLEPLRQMSPGVVSLGTKQAVGRVPVMPGATLTGPS